MNHPEIQPPKKLVRDSRRGKWIPFHGIYCITGEVCAQVRMLIIIIIVKNQMPRISYCLVWNPEAGVRLDTECAANAAKN